MIAKSATKQSSAGVYRFTSNNPESKVYGRLDFLSPMVKRRQSKRALAHLALQYSRKMPNSMNNQSATISRSSPRALKQTITANQSMSIRDSARQELRSSSKSFRRLRVSRQEPHRTIRSSADNPQATAPPRSVSLMQSPSNLAIKEFATTKNSLLTKSIAHKSNDYHRQKCACSQCNCGKHMCQFETIVPSMQIDTSYHQDYNARRPLPALAFKPVEKQTQPSPVNPAVDLISTYLGDYVNRRTKQPDHPHPKDSLKFKGPQISSSTYNNEHPGFTGDNQYVKPTDKYYLEGLSFVDGTVYKKAYLPLLSPSSSKDKFIKHDSLKNLALWLGDSSYRGNYNPPKQRYYPKLQGIKVDKYYPTPDFSSRFETSYKNEYNAKPPTHCRAKQILEQSTSKELSRSRSIFMPMEFTSPSRRSHRQASTLAR